MITPEKKKLNDEAGTTTSLALNQENLGVIWQQVLSNVGFILASELKKFTDIAIFGPNTLVLKIPPSYNSPGDSYLESSRLAKVEEALSRVVGQPCSIRLEVLTAAPGAERTARQGAEPEIGGTAKRQRLQAEIAQVPLVGKAIDVLGGQIVQMDDDFGTSAGSPKVAERSEASHEATEED